jgi:UDP-N-acetylmuramoylalanine--D-glutamate ligase
MAHALYTNLDGKRILVAGAGVTGAACARALEKRGSAVTIVDEKVTSLESFSVITPDAVNFSNFDLLLVSPGWREDHPVVLAARAARIALINEVDLAWSLKPTGQKWIALTGTNGKTSTVELTAAMLRS